MKLPLNASLTDLQGAVPEQWRGVFDEELSRVMLCDLSTWAMGWLRAVDSENCPPRPY
ncbi:hypothetical protein ACFY2K_42660 [Kitasatospora sp. NPDC001309]|uniref:hypothetical protein n=1 Tax=Kitasatospora sp. NPDC001309 TaxID=3364013 RepID=UPI0036A6C911